MKAIAVISLLFVLSGSAFADDAPTVNLGCNLSADDKPNIFTVHISLKATDEKQLGSYLGHKYSVFTHDFSDVNGPTPRHEINLGARTVADDKVVSSAAAIYSVEVPDVMYQDGHVTLICFPE